MWSIVSSMKLLRKPSKRGEGDGDRKSSKDQSNGGASAKVERRESARLSCGASKFLRSLRSGAQSIKENRDQVNVIALKELDSENIDLDVRGQDRNPVFRLPERSQSFQEKRLLVVTSKSSESPTSNGNVKIKHSRAQSFVCTNTQATSPVTTNPSAKSGVNEKQVVVASPNGTSAYGTLIKDKRHGTSTQGAPCETIYENVEVIREQQVYGKCVSSRRNSSTSSLSTNNSNQTSNMKDLQKSSSNNNNNSTSSNSSSLSTSSSSTSSSPSNNNSNNNSSSSSSARNIKENCSAGHLKESMDRRSSRNSTKDSGYDTTHSDYMNYDLIGGSTESVVSAKDYGSITITGSSKALHHNPCNLSKKDVDRHPSGSKSSPDYAVVRSASRECLDDRLTMLEGRSKLRRSISEVPSNKITVNKLQAKSVDNTRAIYSTFANGLSVWNVENNKKSNGNNNYHNNNNNSNSKKKGEQGPVYGIYQQACSNKTLATAVSTLPRRQPPSASSSDYQISAKSTPSLKNAVDNCSWEKRNGSSSTIYYNVSPISSAHSTPNLRLNQQKLQQLQLSNSHLYETPKSVREQLSRGNPAYSSPNGASFGSEKHPGALLGKNLERSNENIYHITFPPSQPIVVDSQSKTQPPSNMSNNVGNNGTCSWAQNDPLLASSSTSSSTSSLSGAPVRDSSTLKHIRYGPGHEKYPSWPIPVSSAAQIDPAGELNSGTANSGSSRSKSWTEQTDYPKEKGPAYARPYMKRMNQAYTQQLKTVMEKCERIPPETYDKSGGVAQRQHLSTNNNSNNSGNRNSSNGNNGSNGFSAIVPPPVGYRDMMYNGNSGYHRLGKGSDGDHLRTLTNGSGSSCDKEYNIPSPPERDVSDPAGLMKPFPAEDLELYAKKYEEMMNQYAHSEGYHSYISSECSSYISSGTPFLDQLRRESESNQQFWSGDPCDPNDPLFGISSLVTSGRESVTTVVTNSSSNSSGTETLKWHGSTSDLSMTSGPGSLNSRVWENQQQQQLQQNIAHSAKVPMPQKLHPESVHLHNGSHRHNKNKLESQQNRLSSTSKTSYNEDQNGPNLKKFPLSTYIRPTTLPLSPDKQQGSHSQVPHHHKAESEGKIKSNSMDSTETSPIIDTSKPPSVAERILELEQQSSHSSPLGKHISAATTTLTSNLSSDKFPKSSSLNSLRDKAQPQHPKPHTKSQVQIKKDPPDTGSSSPDCYSGLWTDFNNEPNSLRSTETPNNNNNNNINNSNNNNNNNNNTNNTNNNNNSPNFPVSYTYLDPEKKHRVADMTLKAIQKKALLSYYERHTGKSSSSNTSTTSSPDTRPRNPALPTKTEAQANLLDKDSPFPTNRLTLSLPRDIDRLKEPGSGRSDPEVGFLRGDSQCSPDESSCRSSSHPTSMTCATVAGKLSPTNSTSNNNNNNSNSISNSNFHHSHNPASSLESNNLNNVDNSDAERSSHSARSLEDLSSSESARMAYMSKYLPHLVNNRDSTGSTPSWSGMNNVKAPIGLSSAVPAKEPAPVPPERPPKKPHLRNMSQQSSDKGTKSPPPPLPRAPVRQPAAAPPVCQQQPEGLPPPVPSKPMMSIPRCMSPDLPPPPPPPVPEEEAEVMNDDPLPPPPTMTEVQNLVGSRSRSVSGLSSYLHKDSYLAQRKERTLGYEGRYRRTLSPSGLGSKSAEVTSPQRPMANATSTEKLESTLSPSAWEKYHNIRAPSTTVIFTSNEIAKSTASSQPVFHRSISWDSNLFNNKTGFSQSAIPPPVAQVAPLRGAEVNRSSQPNPACLEELECMAMTNNTTASSTITTATSAAAATSLEKSNNSNSNSPSLNKKESVGVEQPEVNIKTSVAIVVKKATAEAQCQNSDFSSRHGLESSTLSVTVSPLPYENGQENKENIPVSGKGGVLGLKTSEISLRVNCTSDAYSQTDSSASSCSSSSSGDERVEAKISPSPNKMLLLLPSSEGEVMPESNKKATVVSQSTIPSYTGRQKSNEELECDELSRDLAKQLPQGDKLQSLLVPLPEHKTPADYIEGLFPLELKMRVEASPPPPLESKVALKSQLICQTTSTPASNNNYNLRSSPLPQDQDIKEEKILPSGAALGSSSAAQNESRKESDNDDDPASDEIVHKRCNGHAPLPADSAYFTTSESKAKFLTQYVKDMHNESICGTDSQDLIKQKEELVSRISRKLEILRTEQLEIREEIQSNEHLGQLVIERVKQTAKRNEFDKFKLHVEEIEKITSLLLGLSGRLARAENALMGLAENPNPQEKKILESKRDKLKEQLDEAKILKENIDRRSAQVSGFLQKYLSAEEYADYHHFVKMKAKLIIDSREIDDKIKLGEEQMLALQETLSSSS